MSSTMFHRNLGWFESYLVDLNAVVIAVCQFEWRHRFDRQRLNDALHKCITQHHHLRLNIRTTVKPYEFYFLSRSFLSPIYIELESEDQWQNIVDEEVHSPFVLGNDEECLLKLFVLSFKDLTVEKQYLLIKYHHSIADGTSGMIILNTLLSYYFDNNLILPILPCLPESEILSFPSVSTEDERKTQNLINEMLEYKRQWTPTIPYEVTSTARNRIKYSHGTSENMTKLLQRCRQEKVTIGSVLLASTYFTIAELVKDTWLHDDNSRFENFQFDLDVNLRHRYASPLPRHEHVGVHIAMMNIDSINLSVQTKFWDFSREVHSKVQQNLSVDKHFQYLRANRLCPADKILEERTTQFHGRSNDLNVSNIGSYPFQKEFDDLKLKHYYCVGSDACPFIATNVLLICSVECLDYILLHENGEENEKIAKSWFERMVTLVDTVWKYDQSWSFKNFINQL